MTAIKALGFVLAIWLAATPSLAAIGYAQGAYAASRNVRSERTKVLVDCNHQANQRKLGATSVKGKNFLRQCMRQRGFSGPP